VALRSIPKRDNSPGATIYTNGIEQSEREVRRDRLKAAGATVDIISPEWWRLALPGFWEGTDQERG
jgi:hypothetical protein